MSTISDPPPKPIDPCSPDAAPGAVPVPKLFRERAMDQAQVDDARWQRQAARLESARSDGRTTQHSLLVMVPITGKMDELRELLRKVANPDDGSDFELSSIIPFARIRTLHFARILIHDKSPSAAAPIPLFPPGTGKPQVHGDSIPAKLLFATDFDGPLHEHVDELLAVAGKGLDQVFAFTDGWPGSADPHRVLDFIGRYSVRTNTFYTGTMHRSVDQIHREAELHDRIERYLDEEGGTLGTDPVAIRERIRKWVSEQHELAWASVEPGPFPRLLFNPDRQKQVLIGAAVVLFAVLMAAARLFVPAWMEAFWMALGAAGVLLALVVAAALYLRHLEKKDPVIIGNDVKEHTATLVRTEDRIVQNEMSSVIYIKEPLWFRGPLLRVVLAAINLAAKYLSNQGTLAGIPSIHFARWVIVDEGRRLVFFSNFDGSWDNYLGDFIDKSANGLTAVWSNCVGFPRTRLLFGGGARDEQEFKAYSRDSQIPTQVWYSAYRWLSVDNINNNSRIRLGLYGDMTAEAAGLWLRRFGGSSNVDNSGRGLSSPPACPAALPVELTDMQGLVARSYSSLAHAEYIPFCLPADAAAGRRWVGELAGLVTPAHVSTDSVGEIGEALNLAFTSGGLRALGMPAGTLGTFSREFIEGMTECHRRRLMGDEGESAPPTWDWGGPHDEVHGMLFVYAVSADRLRERVAAERARAEREGVELRAALGSVMLPDAKEHFGFHDGVAQPNVAGFGASDDGQSPSPTEGDILPGEVVLGYRNAYGELPYSPTVPLTEAGRKVLPLAPTDPDAAPGPARLDLGRNGSYLAFRTLEQRVQAFWRFLDEQAGHRADERKRLGAKMLGRWPNGAPLVLFPEAEPAVFDRKTGNDFMYSGEWDDLRGDKCPLGSHIRRTNPRDGMAPGPEGSLLVSNRHRMLRRGRAYGAPLAPSFDPADILTAAGPDSGRGMHFIAFNTDLARQFEFVQSTWVNSRKFGGLYVDPDPVVGPHVEPGATPHPEETSSFTEQRCPVRHRVPNLPRFVNTRGGAYLFMPGLRALRYLSVME
jgi:deferrochelatase/peroxidase EfeB